MRSQDRMSCQKVLLDTAFFQMDIWFLSTVCSAAGVFSLISSGEPFTPDGIIVTWFMIHPDM